MSKILFFVAIAFLGAASSSAAGNRDPHILDSVNGDQEPAFAAFFSPGVMAAGWIYTPNLNFVDLEAIETKFADPVDGRTVTLVLYDGLPSENGQLLRQADFIPQAGVFSRAYIPEIDLTAGNDYFIGFINLGGLGTNTVRVDDPSIESLSPMYYSFGDASFSLITDFWADQQPILRFIPEPSVPLLFVALVAAGFLGRRKI